MKVTGQCESPPERRNFHLNQLSNEPYPCSITTTTQCTYLTKKIMDQETTTTTTTTTSSNIVEKLVDLVISKSSLIIDTNQSPLSSPQTQSWYMNEPTKSILMGSMFGILFVVILLIFIIIIISRCQHLLVCQLNPNNDSKSESLLVR